FRSYDRISTLRASIAGGHREITSAGPIIPLSAHGGRGVLRSARDKNSHFSTHTRRFEGVESVIHSPRASSRARVPGAPKPSAAERVRPAVQRGRQARLPRLLCRPGAFVAAASVAAGSGCARGEATFTAPFYASASFGWDHHRGRRYRAARRLGGGLMLRKSSSARGASSDDS